MNENEQRIFETFKNVETVFQSLNSSTNDVLDVSINFLGRIIASSPDPFRATLECLDMLRAATQFCMQQKLKEQQASVLVDNVEIPQKEVENGDPEVVIGVV